MKKHVFLISCGLIISTGALAKKAPNHQTELIPTIKPTSLKIGNKSINSSTGFPTTIFNINKAVHGNTTEEKARKYLEENTVFINSNKSNFSDLRVVLTSKGKASTTVRFKQFVGDIPVYKSDIAVSINNKNKATYVSASYKTVDRMINKSSGLSDFLAEDIARNYLAFNSELKQLKSDLVVYAEDNIARLAYKVSVISKSKPGEWEVLVDATNGVVLEAFDTLVYANKQGGPTQEPGTVSAFNPDPLSTAGVSYGTSGYVDGNDSNTTQLGNQIYTFNATVTNNGSGTYKLENDWAVIFDHESPRNGLFTQNSNSFIFDRADAGFEATNVFYHIQTYMQYLNETLGVNVMPNNHSGGVRFDPHGFNGADNSSFSPSSDRLQFGEGGVDDGEDADVVIHELGHGLHDWVTGGGLSQVNGLSEGTGDYFANSYARGRPDFQWTPADQEYYWVFSWDGHNPFWNGRRTNYSATYPNGLTGSIHTDGQIWASCLMKVWDELGAAKTDTIVLEGLRMTGSNTNQAQAAQAVLQAAADLNYANIDLITIEDQFNSCGYNVTGVSSDDIIFMTSFEQ